MKLPSLARNPLSIVGAWLTTLAASAFIVYYLAEWFGLVASPYAGLFGFVFVPLVFLAGLLLIPIGMWQEARRRRGGAPAWAWPHIDLNLSHVRKIVLIVGLLTVVNLGIVALAGLGAVHYMETDKFCGQVCHEPMRPEFVGHLTGTHSNVECVRCHVSPGAAGMVRAKLNGTRQTYEVLTRSFNRPIPSSPPRGLPVAADTCLRCHASDRPLKDVTLTTHEYDDDEESSDTPKTLVMFTSKIHWHARADVRLEYVTTDAKREKIPYIKVTKGDGSVEEFFANGVTAAPAGTSRQMDCLDCHSRPAHLLSPSPDRAVDDALTAGTIKRSLPFARREVLAALKQAYPNETAAEAGIRQRLTTFYASHPAPAADVAQATDVAVRLYRTNVFPAMKVTWGTYKSQNGHTDVTGCIRCHDDEHQTRGGGKVLKNDCDLCHKEQKPGT